MKSCLFCASIKLAILCTVASPSLSYSEEYRFNDSGQVKQEFDKNIQFKLPESDPKKPLDPVKDAENKSLFQAPLGYPKKEVYFSYNPGFNGFKNILSSSRTYNYGGANFSGFGGGFIFQPDLESFFSLEANTTSISISDYNDTSAGLKVIGSTIQITSLSFGGNFCSIYESAFHRFCPGVEFALDNFPTLDFPQNSNSQISLKAVQDMTIGINAVYTRSLSKALLLKLKGAYNYGLKVGQSDTLGTKSNQKIVALARVEFPQNNYSTFVDLKMDYRTANMKSSQDTWDIQSTAYGINAGMKWEFGSN